MTELPSRSSTARACEWFLAASLTAAVIAWLLLVLHYEYGIARLGRYVIEADVLFLAGLAGIVVSRSVQRWGVSRVRAVALRLAFSIGLAAVALIAAEFGARYLLRSVLPKDSPHISLNSLGFRGQEFGPKDPRRYRIAIIGDSFTFGTGVEERDRFSNLLQGFLGPDYEVLNFGHPGNNLPDHLAELELVLPMKPDFVLLQLYENDFETPTMRSHRPWACPLLPLDLDDHMARESVLYHILIGQWYALQQSAGLAESYPDSMARHLRDPNAPDAVTTTGQLRQFIIRAREAGVPSGGVLFPALYGLDGQAGDYPFSYLHERVSNVYADLQAPSLDLLPSFRTVRQPRSFWVDLFDPHPNAKANHLAAAAMLKTFLPIWGRRRTRGDSAM